MEPLRLVCSRPPCLRIRLGQWGSHTILQISNFQSHEVRFLVSGFPANLHFPVLLSADRGLFMAPHSMAVLMGSA